MASFQNSGVYTLQNQGQNLTSGQWATEPNFKYTTILLHADGVANATQNNTFLDSSTNTFPITRNGNTTQGTFSPYGPDWSNYFGGSNSGLSIPSSAAFDFSGDFTIEGWVFITSKTNATLISRTTGAGVHEFWIGWDSTTLAIFYNGSNVAYPTDSFSTNQWQHYALVRSGSSVVFYINGVNSGSFTDSASWSSSSAVTVGYAGALSGYGMIGYQSNVRIVKGTAVYTSNFTPSTTPLTEISGTSLLTCQSNRFVDNTLTSAQLYYQTSASSTAAFSSTNSLGYLPASSTSKQLYDLDIGSSVTTFYASYSAAFSGVTILVSADGTSWTTLYASGSSSNTTLTNGGTPFRYVRWWYSGGAWSFGLSNRAITVAGTSSVQRFSPFPPQYQYTSAVIGGSGYFDGVSGDYLTMANNSSVSYGSGAFCLEAWVYATSSLTSNYVLSQWYTADKSVLFGVGVSVSGKFGFLYSKTGSDDNVLSDPSAFVINQWNHVVACRTSNTISLFVNGIRVATTTEAGTLYSSSQIIGIGTHIQSLNQAIWPGYISGLRSVKGSNPYDATQSTLTVPTSPATAIANTSLLLSMTNAGILDNAMMNNLETVGNAQVSTSVVKYGSGSMYFDGSSYLKFLQTSTPQLIMGSADWTVECWVYPITSSQALLFAGQGDSATAAGSAYGLFVNTATTSDLYYNGASGVGTTTPYATVGQWTHIAWVRSGTSVKMYTNGVQTGSSTLPSGAVVNTGSTTYPAAIGAGSAGSNYFNGYIDDFRFTKGVARYTSNFIPPKVAFANQ